jgi:hypothetical protein
MFQSCALSARGLCNFWRDAYCFVRTFQEETTFRIAASADDRRMRERRLRLDGESWFRIITVRR